MTNSNDINTDNLLDQLLSKTGLHTYLTKYDAVFEEGSFTIYINDLLNVKHITKKELIDSTQLSKSYIYQIFKGEKKPNKDTLLQLALSMNCTLKETQRLLTLSGSAILYPKNKRDSILINSITNGLSLYETNEILVNYQEAPLFALI